VGGESKDDVGFLVVGGLTKGTEMMTGEEGVELGGVALPSTAAA
jgi:hypothetical protein